MCECICVYVFVSVVNEEPASLPSSLPPLLLAGIVKCLVNYFNNEGSNYCCSTLYLHLPTWKPVFQVTTIVQNWSETAS